MCSNSSPARPGRATTSRSVDPPYSFGDWTSLLDLLEADLAVLESSVPVVVTDSYRVLREYRYGGTLVTLVEARGPGRDDSRSTEKDPV